MFIDNFSEIFELKGDMNKRIITLFACLAVAITVVVLMTAVFVVRDIAVVATGNIAELEAKVVEDSRITLNSNIFTVSEDKATANIELGSPNIKVESITRVFPSSIRIRVSERVPIVAVPIDGTGAFAILDEDLKILAVNKSRPSDLTIVTGYRLQGVNESHVGQFINTSDDVTYRLKRMSDVIRAMRSDGFIADRFVAFVRYIDISRSDYVILKTVYGANIAFRINLIVNGMKQDASDANQFKSLYSYFCNNMLDKTASNFIFLTADGVSERSSLPLN